MENWRLSRIEMELGNLKLGLESPDVVSTAPEVRDDHKSSVTVEQTGNASAEDVLLNRIIIRPAYSKAFRRKSDANKAIRQIREKYDSPNGVTKPALDADPRQPTSPGVRVTEEATGTFNPAEPDICRIESPPGGRWLAPGSSAIPPPVSSSIGMPDHQNSLPAAVAGADFDFSTTVHNPRIHNPGTRNEIAARLPSGPRSPSRPGPPTAAKPSSSMYLGQSRAERRHEPAKLSPANSFPYTGEGMPSFTGEGMPSSTVTAAAQPPDLVMVQPLVLNDSPSRVFFPEPPSDVHLQQYPLTRWQPQSPTSTEPTVDFKCMPSIGLNDERAFPPTRENPEMLHLASDAFEVRGGDTSYQSNQSFRRRNETEQQPACEPVSMETHTIRHLADSYNCRPRFGTLRATRAYPPRGGGVEPRSGDFFPPSGPCLSDEDRHQVEMFYRSLKTRVFVARCEANLYFGSARRHSAVVHGKAAASRVTESPENWMFLKCGVPVLVLDSGESRRQRRLHIILAERGSGFVLWRDAFDHLTGWSSANVGFHTMHLSKDHTKLAGFYFAESLSATEFFDHLSNLTSDPDDPLLSLSNGTRKKKKDRKNGAAASNRKEKRKPVRREDISLPCCFTHITKLDRNDGLNILLSDDRLLQHNENNSQVEPSDSSPYLPKTPLPS